MRVHTPRSVVAAIAATAAVLSTVPAMAQEAEPEPTPAWEQIVDITFPTTASSTFSNSYTACRSGCSRKHQAADIFNDKMTPLFATVDGTICSIDEGTESSYGRAITLCGDDGNRYRYLHINNDTPGTDDGNAEMSDIYAPGIRKNARVVRGQHLAYMGDSGNAEGTPPHLHFDIYFPGLNNPWGEERANPYPSLMDAIERNDFAVGGEAAASPTERIAGASRIETAIGLSSSAFDEAAHVVLASSQSPQNALVAGPLAAVLGGPVLITPETRLPFAVVEELIRLDAKDVTIVGDALLDDEARRELDELMGAEHVHRLDGGDALTTSVVVADEIFRLTNALGANGPDAVVFDDLEDDDEPVLAVSLSPDRGSAGSLDGAIAPASGRYLHVFAEGLDLDTVRRVRFLIDGETVNIDREWPFDLGGTRGNGRNRGIRADAFTIGAHVITAEVRLRDGDDLVLEATIDVTDVGAPRRAVIARGQAENENNSWPDALGASWYGSVRRLPVLLTSRDTSPSAVLETIASLDELFVAGGPAAITDEQVEHFVDLGADVVRLAGTSRYSTAGAFAEDLIERELVSPSTAWVATGMQWPDATAAGAAIAASGGVLLLVDGTRGTNEDARGIFLDLRADIDQVNALGGPAAISDDTLRRIAIWTH